jgi:hypothetical protein
MRTLFAQLVAFLGSLAVLAISAMPPAPPSPFAAVLYEGVRIPLTRTYADIDEFKDDGPTHLSEAALVAIERGMLKARFGPVFRTQAELEVMSRRVV